MSTLLLPAIAVTGLGCVSGNHATLPELMAALFAPRRVPAPVLRPEARHPAGYPLFALPDERARALTGAGGTLSVGMALTAATEALNQAGLSASSLDPARTGVCLGSSSGASLDFLDYYFAHRRGETPTPASRERLHAVLVNNPAPALARRLGLCGGTHAMRCATITNACCSGTDALGMGLAWLRAGLCDIVLAGGCDELCGMSITGFSRLMVYDSELCRPFDLAHKGLNLGEGAAVLVLERLERARMRGAEVLALLSGYGTAADAHHLTAPHPEGRGLAAAARAALADAGISPEDLGFINAHGTGTRENDKTEAHVFRNFFPAVPVSATKGATGHTLGAAGAIEAAISVACLRSKMLPPSPGFSEPDPVLGVAPVSSPTRISREHALSVSLAFGGNNSAVVFSEVL